MTKESENIPARLERNTIKADKEEAMKMEEDNFEYLILWRSTGEWWKMGGHSALFYAHYVAPQLLGKDDVRMHIDTDRYCNSRDGIVSIRDIDKFTQTLAKKDVKRSKRETGRLAVFKVPHKFTSSELEVFRTEEIGNHQRINEILRSNIPDQYLESEIRKACSVGYNLAKKFDRYRMRFVGAEMLYNLSRLYSLKNLLGRGDITEKVAYEQILKTTGEIMSMVSLGHDLNFFGTKNLDHLCQHLYAIYSTCGSNLKKIEKEKAKAKKGE